MTRALVATLLLCCTAFAERRLIRVGLGEGPFPGACVQVLRAGAETLFDLDAFVPDTLTDERGEAVVDLPDGARVLVYAPGHALAIATPRPGPIDIALRPERRLTSRVVDAQGGGIANAEVLVRTTYREKATFRVRTRQDGTFHVSGLWLDDLSVSAAATGFLDIPAVDLTPGEPLAPLRLDRPAQIDGKVLDEAGHAVAGVVVLVARRRVATGADGGFRLADLPPRKLPIQLEPPYGTIPISVDLADGEKLAGVVVHARRPAQVALRVTDQQGAPLPDAQVNGRGCGPTGALLCAVVPESPAVLAIVADGFETRRLTLEPMKAGATAELGDIVMTPWPRERVRVLLPDGSPATEGVVHGAPIREGVAELRLEGRHGYVSISVPGYPAVSEYVHGGEETLVRLPEPCWLAGVVLGGDGEAVAAAKVKAHRSPEGPEATTDAEGRFRLGPLAKGLSSLTASHPAYRPSRLDLQLDEGLVEIRLARASPPRPLVGQVRRRGDPVQDFMVMRHRILDEAGRFSILLDDPDLDTVSIGVGGRQYIFPLPPVGAPLIADLPGGSIRIELDAPEGEQQIDVRSLSYYYGGRVITGPDGVAVVEGMAPGRYWLEAHGYRRQSVDLGDDGVHTVRLVREASALLVLRTPWGDAEQQLKPTDRWAEFELPNGLIVELSALRLTSGGETRIDLWHPRPATLTLFAAAGRGVSIRGVTPECEVRLLQTTDDEGVARLAGLPPGPYTIQADRDRRTLDIPPGASVEVGPQPGHCTVAGVVRFRDGRPAAGASVRMESDRVVEGVVCDQRGRYAFEGLPEGRFTLTASLREYAIARQEGEIRLGQIVPHGPLDLTLDPAAGASATVLDPAGGLAAYLRLTVDGQSTTADALGRIRLPRLPAIVDIELEEVVAVRGHRIAADGATIRLERAAGLCVWLRHDQPAPTLIARGREWPLRRLPGRASAYDLPPGPARVRWGGEAPPDPLEILLREGEETLLHAPE